MPRVRRSEIELFIRQKFSGINTLQGLSALSTHVDQTIQNLSIQRSNTSDQRSRHDQRLELRHWHLLRKRIEAFLPIFVEQALEEQKYLSLPEYQRVDKTRYRYLCSFRLSPNDLYQIKGYNLLLKYGWYNSKTNPGGVVKDHRFSINMGWKLKVGPEIMSHPTNCEFLFNSDNIRKSDSCSLSLKELIHSQG